MPPDNDDGGERPSPLLASDRVVIDGRARSYGLGVGGSSSRERGGEASSSSFPIKKIAFKVPLSGGKAEPGAAMDGANAATDSVSSAQMRAEKQRREELEREKREARAAGLRGERVMYIFAIDVRTQSHILHNVSRRTGTPGHHTGADI